jgi:uncharacterized membrane protein YfcA
MFTGLVGGFTSGLTGVGGGITMIPLLTSLLGLTQRRAHASSLAIVIAVAAAAVVPYIARGEVDWALAATLALGGAAGAQLGARLMQRTPDRRLRQLFAAFVLLVGLRLLLLG